MKAFLIDPRMARIVALDYSGNFEDIYKIIHADTFDVARFNDQRDGVFVDDEGLLKSPTHFFFIDGNVNLLAGRGLVLGCDEEGETAAPTVTLEWLKDHVGFIERLGADAIAVEAPPAMAHRVADFFEVA